MANLKLSLIFSIMLWLLATPVQSSADERAMVLSMTCTGCHAPSNEHLPKLDTRESDELYQILLAYKQDVRAGTVMNRLAKGYTDEELQLLAAELGQ